MQIKLAVYCNREKAVVVKEHFSSDRQDQVQACQEKDDTVNCLIIIVLKWLRSCQNCTKIAQGYAKTFTKTL